MEDSGSVKNRQRRKTITFDQKREIIRRAEMGQKLADIGRSFGLSRSTISTIVKRKDRIQAMQLHLESGEIVTKCITRRRSGAMEHMERLLKIWLDDQMQESRSPYVTTILKKAKTIYEDVKNSMGETSVDILPFTASWGWFRRFKKRMGLQDIKFGSETSGIYMV